MTSRNTVRNTVFLSFFAKLRNDTMKGLARREGGGVQSAPTLTRPRRPVKSAQQKGNIKRTKTEHSGGETRTSAKTLAARRVPHETWHSYIFLTGGHCSSTRAQNKKVVMSVLGLPSPYDDSKDKKKHLECPNHRGSKDLKTQEAQGQRATLNAQLRRVSACQSRACDHRQVATVQLLISAKTKPLVQLLISANMKGPFAT